MKRYQKTKTAPIAPVKRVEVRQDKVIIRLVVFIFFAILAVVFITLGVKSCLTVPEGLLEIKSSTRNPNCSSEFSFKYYVGNDPTKTAAEEKQALSTLYTSLTEDLYLTFSSYDESSSINNLYYLNHHPNEQVELNSVLYKALEKIGDNRFIFMAPIYDYYNGCLLATNEFEAKFYDPDYNPEIIPYYDELLNLITDETNISLSLLGDNNVRLNASNKYLSYLEENEISVIVDFMYLTNAFIIDEMASKIISSGYLNGIITSSDGYTVNFGGIPSGIDYSIYDYNHKNIREVAKLGYTGKQNVVNWHAFPLHGDDDPYFYRYSDTEIATPYISYGNYHDNLNVLNIVAMSEKYSCAETALKLLDIVVNKEYNKVGMEYLKFDNLKLVYLYENTLFCDKVLNSNVKLTSNGESLYKKETF